MTSPSRMRQWSRAAWALALLFASLPLSSALFLGSWGFEGAAELSFLCTVLGTYLYLLSRRRSKAARDDAALLEEALQLASSGRSAEGIALLTRIIRMSPRLWQAFQYRGELNLRQSETWSRALQDFTEAIRLAPREPHLYSLRAQAHAALGDASSAQRDQEAAAALRGEDPGIL